MTTSAHTELLRLFGEENIEATHIGKVNYYEITMKMPPPIDAQWSADIPHEDHDDGQFAEDEHDKPHPEFDRRHMYLDLLAKLGIDPKGYKEHINKDRLLLKIEDVENDRVIPLLKRLADDHDKEEHERDPELKIAHLDELLETQGAARVDAEPVAPATTDIYADTASRLSMITCSNWKKIDTEAGPAYQTMMPVLNKYAAAIMLSEVFEDPKFSDTFKPKEKATGEEGKLIIPHSQISQKALHAFHGDLREYFHPPASVRKV